MSWRPNPFAGKLPTGAVKGQPSVPGEPARLLQKDHATVGGVLVPGAAAPKLVTRGMVSRMRKGAVVVDVAIDQGGCFETSHPTTHADPTFVVDGVVHYCVANMPGAVARTSTFALNNATIGHAVALAAKGWRQALRDNPHLKNGLNVCQGKVTYAAVANDLGYDYVPADTLLA